MINETVPEFDGSELIPFDIETTGFEVNDKVTTLTFYVDETYYIFVNTGEHSLNEDVEENILDKEGVENIELYALDTERDLLEKSNSIVQKIVDWDEYYITAYNGERWKGGFDLAFLRTVAARYDIETPFSGLYYIDLYPIFDKERINTVGPSLERLDPDDPEDFHDLMDFAEWDRPLDVTHTPPEKIIEEIQGDGLQSAQPSFSEIRDWYNEREHYLCTDSMPTKRYKDLVMVHRLLSIELFGQDEETYLEQDFDPFGDSAEAVTEYNKGNLEDVILHNLADVQKTYELGSFLEKVSEDDVNWRQLPW